jgi:hypothetical protein
MRNWPAKKVKQFLFIANLDIQNEQAEAKRAQAKARGR